MLCGMCSSSDIKYKIDQTVLLCEKIKCYYQFMKITKNRYYEGFEGTLKKLINILYKLHNNVRSKTCRNRSSLKDVKVNGLQLTLKETRRNKTLVQINMYYRKSTRQHDSKDQVLLKTQQIKVQSSRFQKSEKQKRINEQNQLLANQMISIAEGKTSQFRSIWTVQNKRDKPYADTSIWNDNNKPKRLHSPLRRKMQNRIEEENTQLYGRIDQNKQIALEKQQEYISKYEKLKNHMTKIKTTRSSTNNMFPSVKLHQIASEQQLRSQKGKFFKHSQDLSISKISRIE
ncbi:hypothetical protein pb186bvf_005701 [Paramecium bursaria]